MEYISPDIYTFPWSFAVPQHNAEINYVSGDFDLDNIIIYFDNILGIKSRLDKALGSHISADRAFSEGLDHRGPEVAFKTRETIV